MPDTTAAIIGGGIGGLTAAIALQEVGIEVTVYEREPVLGEAGAGITLWADALGVLRELGLGPALDERAVVVDDAVICGPDGQPFPDVWLGSYVEDHGTAPPVCIHRAVLHQALLERAAPLHLVTGAQAVDASPGADGGPSSVRFADGRTVTADVVVGADGLRSAVRQAVFPESAPIYAGQTVYRGVAPAGPAARDRAPFVAVGTGTRFGWEPLPNGQVYWFAGRFQPLTEPDDPAGRQAHLLETFGDWAAPTAELIEGTPPDRILRNDVYVVGPLARWTEGTVALLGDAAHSVPPHVGHGACLAIEDAHHLAQRLAEPGPAAEALARYGATRAGQVLSLFTRAEELGAGLQAGRLPEPAPTTRH